MSVPTQHTQPPVRPAQPTPKNGLGTTSLVMGILSVVGSWIPFVGFGAYVTSTIGLVTGAVGRNRAKLGRATNHGTATGGLVLSVVGLASVILATVVYSSLLYAVASSSPSDLPTTTTTQAAKAKPTHGAKATAGVGDKVKDGKFTFTVTKVRPGVTHIGDSIVGKKAQGQFVLVYVTVHNHGDESQLFDASDQTAYDKAARKYSSDDEAGVYLDNSNAFLNEINPGNTVKGILVFDMPAKTRPTTIELHDSPFSAGVTVDLR
jgi:hypothetical protein